MDWNVSFEQDQEHEDVHSTTSLLNGSFSTHSSHVLHIADVYSSLTLAEELLWRRSGLGAGCSSLQPHGSLATVILRHGKTLANIHKFFSNLESRKCCIHLVGGRTIFSNVRVVGHDDSLEEGAMRKQQHVIASVEVLTDKEYAVFKKTALCAQFPVLFLPSPPTAVSPEASVTPSFSTQRFYSTPWRPHTENPSSSDSLCSITESEDGSSTSLIQAETLCETVRLVFGLSRSRSLYYNRKIYEPYGKRQAAKILVDELMDQLSVLEKNRHPFYNLQNFKTRSAYELWHQFKRTHILELIHKFWHNPVPSSQRASPAFIHNLTLHHEDYKFLLTKLIRYECSCKGDEGMPAYSSTGPLSSASVRLLKEFALRYGVDEVFQQLAYLEYLALHFENNMDYYSHVIHVLDVISDILPTSKSLLLITKQEYDCYFSTVGVLKGQCINSLIHCKRLFPGNSPSNAISLLIKLHNMVLSIQSNMTQQPPEPAADCLTRYIKECCNTAYERHKFLAFTELKLDQLQDQLTPKLLNRLLINIMDEVKDYKDNYHLTFHSYVDCSRVSAEVFYDLLMLDIAFMCDNMPIEEEVSLMYRLNRLDQEWSSYVPPSKQTWRKHFLPKARQWMKQLKVETLTLTIDAIAADKYNTLKVLEKESCTWNPPLSRKRGSVTSLTASTHSAFTSVTAAPQPSYQPHPVKNTSASTPSSPVMERKTPGHILHHSKSLNHVESSKTVQKMRSQTVDMMRSSSRLSGHSASHESSNDNISSATSAFDVVRPAATSAKTSIKRQSYSSPNLGQQEDGVCADESVLSHQCVSGNFIKNRNRDSVKSNNVYQQTYGDEYNINQQEVVSTRDHVEIVTCSPSQFVCVSPDGSFCSEETPEQVDKIAPPYPPLQLYSSSCANNSNAAYRQNLSNDDISLPPGGTTSFRSPKSEQTVPHFFLESVEENSIMVTDATHNAPVSHVSSSENNMNNFKLPLSSSAIDVIALVHRVSSFVETVCQTLYPFQPTDAASYSCNYRYVDSAKDVIGLMDIVQGREMIYEKSLQVMSSILSVYADNMLSMDICGLTENTVIDITSKQVLMDIKQRRIDEQIWGCRHMVNQQDDCFMYLNRKVKFLADKYEPITKEMCTRINNVEVLISLVAQFGQQMAAAVDLELLVDLVQDGNTDAFTDAEDDVADYVLLDVLPKKKTHSISSRSSSATSSKCSSCGSSGNKPSFCNVTTIVTKQLDAYLKSIKQAMINVLCYKVNLFFREALSILFSFPTLGHVTKNHMKPIYDFTEAHLAALIDWTYLSCHEPILLALWTCIIKDFESETLLLVSVLDHSNVISTLTLQTLTECMRIFYQRGQGLNLQSLSHKAGRVTYMLQLLTCPTPKLKFLHEKLKGLPQHSENGEENHGMEALPLSYLINMRTELHSLRKCFSGRQLIQWIMDNPLCSDATDDEDIDEDAEREQAPRYSESEAVKLAQSLLHHEVIMNIEEAVSQATSTDSSTQFYPDVVEVPLYISSSLSVSGMQSFERSHHLNSWLESDSEVQSSTQHNHTHDQDRSCMQQSPSIPVDEETNTMGNQNVAHVSNDQALQDKSFMRASPSGDGTERPHKKEQIMDDRVKSKIGSLERIQNINVKHSEKISQNFKTNENNVFQKEETESQNMTMLSSQETVSDTNTSDDSSTFRNADNAFYLFHNMLDEASRPLYLTSLEAAGENENDYVYPDLHLTGPVQKCLDNNITSEFIEAILFCRYRNEILAESI